ncbi:MAG: NADH-quinone oxidoreductase subunit H [Acidobacteria bacterium]|jgi:formate hydrogenlyase subunit 4|nr:NADH-quinone oxidoreductase subunit H [Acidobacteriota bacterium]
MIEILLNIAVLFFLPFLYIGLINRVKSLWAGRKGPSIWQPFFDFARLMKKGTVISSDTSFIFRMAPSLTLAAVLTAGLVTPMIRHTAILSFAGDFIFFAYILALGKFFSIIAAMDTGSSFEGMGASREATFSVFVEPAFFLVTATFCFMSGYTHFAEIFSILPAKIELAPLVKGLGALVIFIMVLVEGCRVPVDDPNTHLELTMIHEVMILDNSGPDLGFIQYAAAARMVILSSLIPNLLIPAEIGLLNWVLAYVAIIVIIAVVVGLLESLLARMRMIHVPQFIFLMTAVSIVVLAAAIIFTYGGNR